MSERAVRDPAEGSVERLVTAAALLAGYALLALALLMTFEIVGRKLFNYSVQGVDELGGYTLAVTATLGFGYATLKRAHTRVDLLLKYLPAALRAFLHLLAYLTLAGSAAFLAWYGWKTLGDTLLFGSVANSPLQTPLWIPQTVFLAGLVTFLLTALLVLWRVIGCFGRGRFATIDRDYGSLTVDEEIEEAGTEVARAPEPAR